MNCPKCGKILEEGAVICPNCGETVVENIAEENVKRSVVSEDVLRNFSDPEHIQNEDEKIVFSESTPKRETEQTEDDDQFFDPDVYLSGSEYGENYSDGGEYSKFYEDGGHDGEPGEAEEKSALGDTDGSDFDIFNYEYSQRGDVEDYNVFDDGIDDSDEDEPDDEDDEDEEDYNSVIVDTKTADSAGSKRTKMVLIAVLILAALVMICGIIYLVFGEQLGLTGTTENSQNSTEPGANQTGESFTITVPNLYNLQYNEAVTKAKEYGLKTEIDYDNSDTVEKGYVIRQSLSAGTKANIGDVITITISLGKEGQEDTTADNTQNTTDPTEESQQTSTDPTEAPTQAPTQKPTEAPTEKPTNPPTTEPPTQPPTTEKPTEPPTTPENNYYLLPDSATRLLTVSDLEDLTLAELELARNEIYARHGRKFATDYIQAYFNSQQWYSGTIDPEDFDYGVLSEIEVANVWFIYDYEHSF